MRHRPEQLATPVPSSRSSADAEDRMAIEAIGLHHAGEAAAAEQLYRTILESPSGHAVASYGFGLLCAAQGRLPEAIAAYRDAIAMRPEFVDAYINLGTVILGLGRPEEALALYRRAIEISPGNAMAHGNLGKALQDLGQNDDAIAAYRAALALEPENAVSLANLGAVLLEQAAWNDSITVSRRAISLRPDHAMAHANLGTALMNLGRHEEALAACRQAIASQPSGVATHASLGGAMLELGALPEAVALCRHAIALDATLASAHFNLSHALKAMNHLDEATLAARQAVALTPDSAEYHFHLAHILLLRGDLAAGWAEYDWRWKLADFAWISQLHGGFSQPVWRGEDIRDKTLLVCTEQGLGDIILFARYLPLAVRAAAHVIVAAHPGVCRLLESIEGIEIVSIRDATLPDFDVHCPLLSLPRAFATTLDNIPATVPYLGVNASARARWNRRMDGDALRVGLVWAGNPATKRDRFRSPGLANVRPLFSVPGVDFVVLQVGAGREELDANPLPADVLDLGAEVEDLTDTAAIMASLDLVISSCTAPLHLAAALAIPTWAMIPCAPYFPWLLDRTDTPWYPTVRLYRQKQAGLDWSEVVSRIAVDLGALARSRQRPPSTDHSETTPRHPCPDGNEMTRHERSDDDRGAFNELAPCRSGLMLYNRHDTYIGASLRKYGEFSREETVLFELIVQPGRTVLDIGANIGAHTIDMSRLVGESGVVHAFEPQRLAFQILCANVALNSRANVYTHHAAVGAVGDTILVPALDPDQQNNYGGLTLIGTSPGERVPLVTVDGLRLQDCQFIKLDVEGMETEALRGASATIARFRPILYVENDRQARSAELIALIQEYGYRLYWHLPPIYSANNFRGDCENIFGAKVSVNMICIPMEIPQASLTNLREVSGPADSVIKW